jgi:two-component system chemotaxis sensor kinase CheA
VRLDAQVLGIVQGALVQMVRNAVAHGIETAAERRAAGKPAHGRIALQVERQGYRVCLRCIDDGRGIDTEAVRQALQRRGLPAADLQGRDESQLLALLLRGGVSTASAVTELAGRGIGLDVVREAMRQLGGDALASTRRGAGTTLALHVPVSLAALDVLGVEVDGQPAAIPLEGVRRTLRIAPQDVTRSPEGDAILHDGALIELRRIRLSAAREAAPAGAQATSAIIVGEGAAAVALAVDRLHGTQRIVQRPLPALALAEGFVCGTYLQADGTPGIVLDPGRLAAAARSAKSAAAPPAAPIDPILIVDDSLTTRMLESSILESAGYAVDLAASGEEAWTMARRTRYALFLVDVEMPGMSGFEFVAGTRADPVLGGIPCILVTSRDSAEDRRRGEAAGAAAYIVKSAFEQDAFLQRVRSLVQR